MNSISYSGNVINNPANTSKQIISLSKKLTCLIASIMLFLGTHASDTTIFRATGAFFALSVADAEASSKWYREKIGMNIIMQMPKQDKHTVVVLEGGGLIVELIQNDDALPLSKVTSGITNPILVHGIFKAGVIVEDLDKLVAIFRKRDVDIAYGPFPSRPGQRSNFIIRDNEGNMIQFFGK